MNTQPIPVSDESPAGNSPSHGRTAAWRDRCGSGLTVVLRHATRHTGVGLVCAVAYFDPGNWGVDLQAGSQFGYKLLFAVLLAGIIAVFWQALASRLGCVTGLDLASHCRLLLYNRSHNPRFWRWVALYPLYALSEVAIIATDLAELLGSAIALCLLFPSLPLWAGVLLTASDVLILLAAGDPLRGKPVKLFELLIGILVFAVLICMAIIIAKVQPNWGSAFDGFLPSKTLFQSDGLYTAVGIIGATVMPHSLFLGSALATQDRTAEAANIDLTDVTTTPAHTTTTWSQRFRETTLSIFRVRRVEDATRGARTSYADHENNSLSFIQAHLYHGIIDVVSSLLCFAIVINAFILILASAVFYYGPDRDTNAAASLFDAHALIRDLVGKPAATLFALALLCSGQSSSIIATVAGQVVCEGFIQWRLSPVLRRLLTRLVGLIPSLVIAAAVGRPGINALLVISQVVLSIVLPFVTFPLIWLTSSDAIMRSKEEEEEPVMMTVLPFNPRTTATDRSAEGKKTVEQNNGTVSFANGRIVTVLGYSIWLLVVIANVYVLVELGRGQG